MRCGESWADMNVVELRVVGLDPGAREADRVSSLVPVSPN